MSIRINYFLLFLIVALLQYKVVHGLGNETKNQSIDPNTVFGRFIDENGKPINDVRLRISLKSADSDTIKPSVLNLVSDQEGKFSFIAPKIGNISIIAYPKSFALAHWNIEKRGDLGDFVLKKGFQPRIRLLTPKGEPISGVVLRLAINSEDLFLPLLSEKPTDKDGYCTFQRVETGQYRISVAKRQSFKTLKELPFVILNQMFSFSEESHEIEMFATETISATILFSDNIVIPNNTDWVLLRTLLGYENLWSYSFKEETKEIEKGIYIISNIPKNVPLCLSIFSAKNLVFSCSMSAEKQERFIPGFLDLGTFEEPFTLKVFSHKASSVTLAAKDEEGKTIDNFYAVGYYPNLSSFIDGSSYFEEGVMEIRVRIKPEQLQKRFLNSKDLVSYNFARSFEMRSQVTFSWDHLNKVAGIFDIIPNETIIIILYDIQGRQGYIETTLTEGENKEFVVVLKKN
jgi:hypothetical protein